MLTASSVLQFTIRLYAACLHGLDQTWRRPLFSLAPPDACHIAGYAALIYGTSRILFDHRSFFRFFVLLLGSESNVRGSIVCRSLMQRVVWRQA